MTPGDSHCQRHKTTFLHKCNMGPGNVELFFFFFYIFFLFFFFFAKVVSSRLQSVLFPVLERCPCLNSGAPFWLQITANAPDTSCETVPTSPFLPTTIDKPRCFSAALAWVLPWPYWQTCNSRFCRGSACIVIRTSTPTNRRLGSPAYSLRQGLH